MGVKLETEEQYRELQKLGEFDKKTSSWARTTAEVRNWACPHCDRRFGRVFVYHTGAQSDHSARGFRGP